MDTKLYQSHIDESGPEQEALNDIWFDWFKDNQSNLPEEATSLNLGYILYMLLHVYNPPPTEINNTILKVLFAYNDEMQAGSGYMN